MEETILAPGMELLFVDKDEDSYNEEFIVCRVDNSQLNLFSKDDWNRWTNEGVGEGTILGELNESAEDGHFVLLSTEKAVYKRWQS